MPPSPELAERIVRTKRLILAGRSLTEAAEVDILDLRTFTLITNRPNKTREHTLVAPTETFAPVLGTRRALVCLVDFSDSAAAQSQQHYRDLLFSVGTYATGSMRDFYREASYGKLEMDGQIAGAGGQPRDGSARRRRRPTTPITSTALAATRRTRRSSARKSSTSRRRT